MQFRYGNPDHTLGNVQEFKYLGVVFSPNLKWHKHVDLISAKSLKKLGYLRRTLKGATKECKLIAYKSLVRPLLEYASVVWSPHLATDKDKLESVQRKAIRFIFNRYDRNFSPSEHYHVLSLNRLERRRMCDRLIMLHNIVHKSVRIATPISFTGHTTHVTRRYNPLNIVPFRCYIDCYKYSFFPSTVDTWNNLDSSLRRLPHAQFVKQVSNYVF